MRFIVAVGVAAVVVVVDHGAGVAAVVVVVDHGAGAVAVTDIISVKAKCPTPHCPQA
jgi:hypothetical protein